MTSADPSTLPSGQGWRISTVVQQTGLSKELIHHYLRQGLIPRSDSRGLYSEQQVRLLRQIRTLREDHNLPLEVIRRVFELYDFDPTKVESLTLSESLCKRMTRFASGGELMALESWPAARVCELTGISAERLAEHMQSRLVTPLDGPDEPRFSAYDANVIALTERGLAQGIPVEAFTTVTSYIRVAFELEHAVFFEVAPAQQDGERMLAELFLRRELVQSFVQNVLSALTQSRLQQLLRGESRLHTPLDQVVYRPSGAFSRKHGIDKQVERARGQLSQDADAPQQWQHLARLMIHAGSYRECVLLLDEGLQRWPEDRGLRGELGRALVLRGDIARGQRELERASLGREPDALVLTYGALCRFHGASRQEQPEALVREAAAIQRLVRQAEEAAAAAPAITRLEVATLGAWLLSALPPGLDSQARGQQRLLATLDELQREPPAHTPLPGQVERCLINAAYLLHECLLRLPAVDGAPTADELRTQICCLDPGSSFARAVYLDRGSDDGGSEEL